MYSQREIDKNCTISEGVFNALDGRRVARVVFFYFIRFRRSSITAAGVVCLTRGHPSARIVTKSCPDVYNSIIYDTYGAVWGFFLGGGRGEK